ncbi:MAG: mechanosensitive ion channel family protein [Dehalococcoidales bacterium]|nr:mechanosensitive ion channel family protein [Dehalococcoidales bacterium]
MKQILFYSLVFGVFVGLAWLFHFYLHKVARRLAQKTRTLLDDAIISAIDKPIMAVIILAGVHLVVLSFPLDGNLRLYATRGLSILVGILSIYTVIATFDAVIMWYKKEDISKRKHFGLIGPFLTWFRVIMLAVGVMLAALLALGILGVSLTPVTSWLGNHGWRIALITILAMAAIITMSEMVPRLVSRTLAYRTGESEEESNKRGDTLSRVLIGTGQIAVLLTAVFMLLAELEINITPILAGVGVVGIAIGFGAQGLVKDIVNGLFIVFENQYRVGDWVKIADVDGLVEDVNLRRTMLRDFSGTVHMVPNGEIRVASNYTKELARVNMNVSVAYGEDLDRAISVINRVGKELADDPKWAASILTPPQALGVENLGDSGIEIKILGDTKPMLPWAIMRELRLRLKKAFDKEGIEIPWPHMKVYFGNSPSVMDIRGSAKSGHF